MNKIRGVGNKKEKILTLTQLERVRKENRGKRVVFCTGCFDVMHAGHAVFVEQCRELGEVLVVGMGRDETLRALKGKDRPINNEKNRAYMMAALGDVDYVVLNERKMGEGKIDFGTVMKKLRPDVFVLNKDDSGMAEKQKLCKKLGVTLVKVGRVVPRYLQKTSSTQIIAEGRRRKIGMNERG